MYAQALATVEPSHIIIYHMVTNRKLNTWCNTAHSMAKEPGKLEWYGLDLTLDAGLALLWQDSV